MNEDIDILNIHEQRLLLLLITNRTCNLNEERLSKSQEENQVREKLSIERTRTDSLG